jgi:hypothetical protein
MRWLGILVRVVGWLLTPLVVWAASFSAAWLVLQAAPHIEQPRRALAAAPSTCSSSRSTSMVSVSPPGLGMPGGGIMLARSFLIIRSDVCA